jgi:NAD(P)-dependent dehydrogenase (short-subunit alcohol dehydrogenase family)
MANSALENKRGVALITGGSRRIGRAIAVAISRAGFDLVLHAHRSRQEAEELAAEIAQSGGRASVVLADLSDPHDVDALVPAACAFGKLTLLVNNASEFIEDDFGRLERSRFNRTLAVNLAAPIFIAQAFAAQAERGGSIVNIVDQRVLKPTPLFLSYSVSKSALHSATAMLAQALAPKLRVNAVAPGPTLPSPRQTMEQFLAQAATVPLGAGPPPEDIADAVVYLATARSVTGVTIAVDGGQHLAWRTPDSELPE